MTEPSLGQAVKDYVTAKWRHPHNEQDIVAAGRRLDPAIRDRVDALGVDDARLLRVPDDQVLDTLRALERNTQL